MKIIEIPSIQMDTGAPDPILFRGEFASLFVIFYGYDPLAQELSLETDGVYTIKFSSVRQYKFGGPNDEALSGHPYYKIGLQSYGFYELLNSDWIKELMKIYSVHTYFNKDNWTKTRHFIITFHDNMLECIADGYELLFERKSIKEKAQEISSKIISSIEGT